MMASGRRKLHNDDEIDHPVLGKLTIRVTHRDNYIPPDLWEVINEKGEIACPCAYSERGLHFILRRSTTHFNTYSFV
jgi:hypothetical protein